nr:MAG TPA: hypothetical protein [Caudoviricetes sp.]
MTFELPPHFITSTSTLPSNTHSGLTLIVASVFRVRTRKERN